jgi:hypothetical protein
MKGEEQIMELFKVVHISFEMTEEKYGTFILDSQLSMGLNAVP